MCQSCFYCFLVFHEVIYRMIFLFTEFHKSAEDRRNIQQFFFMYHLNVGAELRLLSFLDLRGGLNQGYWTLGVGLDLWAVKVDVSYFHQEFGVAVGDNGLDGLTVRVNIGFDR